MASFPTEFDDVIFGNNSTDIINALGGNDLIFGNGGADWLLGGEGNDILVAGAGEDILDGGKGRDTANYAGYAAGVAVDLEMGSGGLKDDAGDTDTLVSIENVTGSAFNDTLAGNGKSNVLAGGKGNDVLIGGGGADELLGGDGFDTILGGEGADAIDGGAGLDTIWFKESAAAIILSLASGAGSGGDAEGDTFAGIENVLGSAFGDTIGGDGACNSIDGIGGNDTLNGLGGGDILTGGSGADVISGGKGDDLMAGDYSFLDESWNDTLKGGSGNDTLQGGLGADTLTGGADADTFLFRRAAESTTQSRDTITDFEAGIDKLHLNFDLNELAASTQHGATFIGSAAFSANDPGQLRIYTNGGDTYVQVNTGNDTLADFTVKLTGIVTLAETDFLF